MAPCHAAVITNTSLTSGTNTTDASSFTTASITPTGKVLQLAAVFNTKATAPDTPTLSGNGITWVQVATATGNNMRITLFRGMVASPTTGAVTIDFAGATQTGCAWSISEFAQVDTTGTNGSGAVVQSATGAPAPKGTSLSIALVAFGTGSNNAAYGAFGIDVTTGITPETGYTEIHDVSYITPTSELETEWKRGQDLTVSATFANANRVGIAIEINAAVAAVLKGATIKGATIQ